MASSARTIRASSRTLKDQNSLPLLAVLGANLVVLFIVIRTDTLFSLGINAMLQQWREIVPAGIGIVLTGVVNGLLSPLTKARLVYWRWSNPLPGSFAFSRYAPQDPRIDLAALKKSVGEFPSDPRDQNSLWYKLYRSVSDDPVVANVHRMALFTRDYAGIAFLLLFVGSAVGWWGIPSATTAALYTGFVLLQYLLVRHAAQNYGVRFVATVLAIRSTQ